MEYKELGTEVTNISLFESINQLEKIDSLVALETEITNIGKEINAKNFAFCVFSVDPTASMNLQILGHLSLSLRRLLKDDQLVKSYCQMEMKPIRMNKLPFLLGITDQTIIKAFNIFNDTLIVPFKGLLYEFGCLILRNVNKQSLKQEQLNCIVRVQYMYDAYKKCNRNAISATKFTKFTKFTKRELECIKWATQGKTSWEISQILSIADRTVNFHIANCIKKTKSNNRQQAIAKFYSMGIL